MPETEPYYVLLDANVWVTERLLQSSIGSALLYALTRAKASVLLPEIVELEVNRVLPELAERAVSIIGRETSLLRQLSGHTLLFTGPTALAIKEGIADRWNKLDGLLTRIPFTHEHARAALNRVIRKSAPCGENNEQFRDCCIWDAGLSVASERVVHFISGDSAFYEGRNRSSGLATALREELQAAKKEIRIYPALRDFLATLEGSAASIDEDAIGAAIVQAVTLRAREYAAEHGNFELAEAHMPRISGYATPKPSLIAVSFEVSFDLERGETRGETRARDDVTMTLKGVCSYDPTLMEVSEIEIREWSQFLKHGAGGFSGHSSGDRSGHWQYLPTHVRVIS
jgi:hypothetical protein